MAKVFISEFTEGGLSEPYKAAPNFVVPLAAEQTVAIGATSVQSAAFNAQTTLVRIHTDAICSVQFGADPTATANTMRLAANTSEYFRVTPGHKVAVITNT